LVSIFLDAFTNAYFVRDVRTNYDHGEILNLSS